MSGPRAVLDLAEEDDRDLSRREATELLKTRFLEALKRDDAAEVSKIIRTTSIDIDAVLDVEDRDMTLASYKQGYWLPGYKLETSWAMGLHVCMMYNALESAIVLLQNGAAVNRKPNGKTPLHVACTVSNADCVELLLEWGARINSMSLGGHTPLHYCVTSESLDCAKHLILKGANINMPSEENQDTPLHKAARFGVPELVALYISQGADINAVNGYMETPLITAAFWAMDMRERTYSSDHHLVCRILLDHNANLYLHEEDKKTVLHKACWNCDHVLIQMFLEAGAETNAMDVNGCAAIQYLLKVTQIRPWAIPERCYQLLLNYGAARVYPPQFHKRHRNFYDSLFAVCTNNPRTLQHLARCAIRAALSNRCELGVQRFILPSSVKKYLLLEPVGIIY
ncbi:ankyrin repeat and SOCS box protein 4 isoform X2 [Rhinichthys klamathensis goyatoka]|uniref:ankyrin repeat and SOCS box protein 4 isoform X2 n=1 Tax=Rhinichthys klamathensis goyatoka TaxID=3034132 RepID=UPI0024B4ECD7|nr:ankyrin repeat and SOCS box protein 4 isoform X2 [Rhinichthys klamathensis goyatoka]